MTPERCAVSHGHPDLRRWVTRAACTVAAVAAVWAAVIGCSAAGAAEGQRCVTTADLVCQRIGEYQFRIPRAYFRDPPHPSGTATGFYVWALWPSMEPRNAANARIFSAPAITPEATRRLAIVLTPYPPTMPRPTTPWMLENAAREITGRPTRLDEFDPPSTATFGLPHLPARTAANSHLELFYGQPGRLGVVAIRCHATPQGPDGLQSCQMWFDWRPGYVVSVRFLRPRIAEWRAIAEATFALTDRFSQRENSP